MTSNRSFILYALAVTLVAGGCVDRAAQKQAKITQSIITNPVQQVDVTPVVLKNVSQKLEITGALTTSNDVEIGAKVGGRLVNVFIQDGSPVKRGQVIAQQDTANAQITLQQDVAQVQSAQAALNQALDNARIGPQKSQTAVLQARAQLAQSQSALQKALNGARTEEKAEADATVASAKSTMDTAKKQRDRQRQLLDQGAISQQDFDTAENAFETAESAYQSAVAAQGISRAQTRPEDIAAARAMVAQSQQGLQTALEQKKLDSLFKDQVDSAKAALNNAIAVEHMAQQSIRDLTIRAPFDGTVNGRPAEPGTVLGVGGTVAQLVGSTGTYFEGNVSENDVAGIHAYSPVEVSLDALPGRTFPGHVQSISPSASTTGRLFTVRVILDTYFPGLKPGMFARGDITEKVITNATVVPNLALIQQNGLNYVYLAQNGKAHMVAVKTGLLQGSDIQVEGLKVGDQVITTGQNNVGEGTQIKIDTVQASTNQRGS
ncbi:MAG TPA: efflux RND transporter periplasmic adaptor subunit [Fimbriimonadaceae bacterium]|jgi:RND family efflux transporter MFP subunit